MKHLLALVATATLASTLAQADSPSSMNKRSSSSQQEKKPACPVDDKYGPCLRQGFFLTADFLYWIAHQEGLEYATTGVAQSGSPTPVARGSAIRPNFKWKPGFRVGLGWTLPNSYWDLGATWTWYHSRAKGSATHSTAEILTNPLLASLQAASTGTIIGVTPEALSAASASWRLCYNVVDVELGRSFFPNKHLAVRPHAGVRGAWLNQHYSNQYTFVSSVNTAAVSRKLASRFNSAGFKTGVDSLWSCNRYWGIFANTSISLVSGVFRVFEKDSNTFNAIPAVLTPNFINTKDRFFSVVPVFETAMGFHLMLAPDSRHYWFDLNAGWEYTVWFNQNQMPLYVDDVAVGTFIRERANLHLMGFTLNAKLHF